MIKDLPKKIPIFPLKGVIFFPETNLPLNIFEDRYLNMVEDTLNKNGLLGMIQSKEINGDVFHVGCLGKIIKHERTSDGRILINLKGLTRFKIDQEVKNDKPYREFLVNYDVFKDDMHPKNNTIENDNLSNLINYSKKYFDQIGIQINWSELSKLSISQQIYTLAMISPFSNGEKQKLLEIVKLEDMVNTLKTITKFTFYEDSSENTTLQ
jgi:Lon protease-like protein|tara:strand:- start:487 stop:1116 length:630 start_codon:yes stop_codon:yes gene_type:complete